MLKQGAAPLVILETMTGFAVTWGEKAGFDNYNKPRIHAQPRIDHLRSDLTALHTSEELLAKQAHTTQAQHQLGATAVTLKQELSAVEYQTRDYIPQGYHWSGLVLSLVVAGAAVSELVYGGQRWLHNQEVARDATFKRLATELTVGDRPEPLTD